MPIGVDLDLESSNLLNFRMLRWLSSNKIINKVIKRSLRQYGRIRRLPGVSCGVLIFEFYIWIWLTTLSKVKVPVFFMKAIDEGERIVHILLQYLHLQENVTSFDQSALKWREREDSEPVIDVYEGILGNFRKFESALRFCMEMNPLGVSHIMIERIKLLDFESTLIPKSPKNPDVQSPSPLGGNFGYTEKRWTVLMKRKTKFTDIIHEKIQTTLNLQDSYKTIKSFDKICPNENHSSNSKYPVLNLTRNNKLGPNCLLQCIDQTCLLSINLEIKFTLYLNTLTLVLSKRELQSFVQCKCTKGSTPKYGNIKLLNTCFNGPHCCMLEEIDRCHFNLDNHEEMECINMVEPFIILPAFSCKYFVTVDNSCLQPPKMVRKQIDHESNPTLLNCKKVISFAQHMYKSKDPVNAKMESLCKIKSVSRHSGKQTSTKTTKIDPPTNLKMSSRKILQPGCFEKSLLRSRPNYQFNYKREIKQNTKNSLRQPKLIKSLDETSVKEQKVGKNYFYKPRIKTTIANSDKSVTTYQGLRVYAASSNLKGIVPSQSDSSKPGFVCKQVQKYEKAVCDRYLRNHPGSLQGSKIRDTTIG